MVMVPPCSSEPAAPSDERTRSWGRWCPGWLTPGSVRLLASEIRQFLAYLDRTGRGVLGTVTADDVRGFMVEMAPKRPAGIGNLAWSLKRFFAFLNVAGLSDVRIDGLLALAAPRRVRALPCFTPAEA